MKGGACGGGGDGGREGATGSRAKIFDDVGDM